MLIQVIVIDIPCKVGFSLHRFNKVNVKLQTGFESNTVGLAKP